mgnify:CR=1 FL=1
MFSTLLLLIDKDMITDLNDIILLFISDRLGRMQETYEEKSEEINDILEILDILNREYNIDVSEIKSKVLKILKDKI